MPADTQFRTFGRWALASDPLQWLLQRRNGDQWRPVSFVRSTMEILARCMHEKGTPADDAKRLLDGLPSTNGLNRHYQSEASDPGHMATT
jgi:hypothetical protein